MELDLIWVLPLLTLEEEGFFSEVFEVILVNLAANAHQKLNEDSAVSQPHTCQPLLGVNLIREVLNLYFPYPGRGPEAA